MNEQELLLKTNNELAEISQDLFEKIKETDKNSPKRKEYFEDLQTVMAIRKQRAM